MEKSQPRAWYERDPRRLRQDIDDLFWRFPTFCYIIADGRVIWRGSVKILTPEGNFKEYGLRIECSADYPSKAPRVYCKEGFPLSGRWRPPHLYKDDSLCLFYPDDEPGRRWTEGDRLSTIVAWACEWLHAYEYWRRTGGQRWPGREASHRRRAKKKP